MSDKRSPEEIQESIEETREQLAEDLDKLGEKLSPEGLKEEAASQLESLTDAAIGAVSHAASSVTGRAESLGENLTGDLRNEPLPMALLGAALGVGWLLVRSAQRDTRRHRVTPSPYIAPGSAELGVTADVRETTLLDDDGRAVYSSDYDSDYDSDHDNDSFAKQNGLLIGAGAVAAGAVLGLMLPTEKLVSGSQSDKSKNKSKGNGFHLRERVRVNKGADELYAFWRKLENLPQVMSHLESVTEVGGKRSHWVANGPVGTSVEWDAVITDDRPGESLAWRSDPDSQVPNEGAVAFRRLGDKSTDIIVALTYHPPGGALGAAVANLFGASPQSQISDDLENFKERVESGALLLGAASSASD